MTTKMDTAMAVVKDLVAALDFKVGVMHDDMGAAGRPKDIQISTRSGAISLKDLVQLAARPSGVPAFGTSQVPQTVVVPVKVRTYTPTDYGGQVAEQVMAKIYLNFLSDDELTQTIPNPSVTSIINRVEDGSPKTVDVVIGTPSVTWREADDPVAAADAIEQLARTYGWNPEGAAAMGYQEVGLGAWLLNAIGLKGATA